MFYLFLNFICLRSQVPDMRSIGAGPMSLRFHPMRTSHQCYHLHRADCNIVDSRVSWTNAVSLVTFEFKIWNIHLKDFKSTNKLWELVSKVIYIYQQQIHGRKFNDVIYNSNNKNKWHRINITKDVQDLYTEYYRTLLINYRRSREMEIYIMFMDWKDQYY